MNNNPGPGIRDCFNHLGCYDVQYKRADKNKNKLK